MQKNPLVGSALMPKIARKENKRRRKNSKLHYKTGIIAKRASGMVGMLLALSQNDSKQKNSKLDERTLNYKTLKLKVGNMPTKAE